MRGAQGCCLDRLVSGSRLGRLGLEGQGRLWQVSDVVGCGLVMGVERKVGALRRVDGLGLLDYGGLVLMRGVGEAAFLATEFLRVVSSARCG